MATESFSLAKTALPLLRSDNHGTIGSMDKFGRLCLVTGLCGRFGRLGLSGNFSPRDPLPTPGCGGHPGARLRRRPPGRDGPAEAARHSSDAAAAHQGRPSMTIHKGPGQSVSPSTGTCGPHWQHRSAVTACYGDVCDNAQPHCTAMPTLCMYCSSCG